MRYYVLTYVRRGETAKLGATSAAEAVRAIAMMQADGWVISLVTRGTESIQVAELRQDAETEAHRSASP